MKCFPFSNGGKGDPQARKSPSAMSSSTTSTDRDMRKSESEFNSQNVTDGRSPFLRFSQRPCNLRTFTFKELRNATRGFSRSLRIGEGGFGCVYRATIRSFDDSNTWQDVAVKQLHRKGLQGHKEWLNEVKVLGVVEHPNLVKLIGYCAEDDERGMQLLLVYEFMPNRSVENHLSTQSTTLLSWAMRLRIALDSARGLTYLHEETDFQIIFRDLKASNILLDEHWNAKLSDFGLAREGPAKGFSHVSTAVVGTIGYAAPEYVQTGRLTVKSDIWSYGVFLYELITGRRPMDRNRPKAEQRLLDWLKPYKSGTKKFHMILDPRLEGNYSLESATKLAAVANRCLARHPKSRPKMSEVLKMVQSILEKWEIGTLQPHPRSSSEEATSKESIKRGMKPKRTGDLKVGEGSRLVGQGWKPKPVRRI